MSPKWPQVTIGITVVSKLIRDLFIEKCGLKTYHQQTNKKSHHRTAIFNWIMVVFQLVQDRKVILLHTKYYWFGKKCGHETVSTKKTADSRCHSIIRPHLLKAYRKKLRDKVFTLVDKMTTRWPFWVRYGGLKCCLVSPMHIDIYQVWDWFVQKPSIWEKMKRKQSLSEARYAYGNPPKWVPGIHYEQHYDVLENNWSS